VRSHEEPFFDLLLSDPEIVTWLEPDERDDDENKPDAARPSRSRIGPNGADATAPGGR
jgi:hypothetical protein